MKRSLKTYGELNRWWNELNYEFDYKIAMADSERKNIYMMLDEMILYEKLYNKEDRAYQIMVSLSEKMVITLDKLSVDIRFVEEKMTRISNVRDRKFEAWMNKGEKK